MRISCRFNCDGCYWLKSLHTRFFYKLFNEILFHTNKQANKISAEFQFQTASVYLDLLDVQIENR